MQKKVILIFAIIISIIFSYSICFATDGTDAVRNTVNDAGNMVEGAMENVGNMVENTMNNVGNAMKDSTEKTENTMENAGNAIEEAGNTIEKDTKNVTSDNMGTNNDTYTATRSSTNGNATFMGMNSTAWTWLILGIAAIAIIAIVWYYSMQMTSEKNNSRRD